jgi:hypothetical protein
MARRDRLERRRKKLPPVGHVGMGRSADAEQHAVESWLARTWRDAVNAPTVHKGAYVFVSLLAGVAYEAAIFPFLSSADQSVSARAWAAAGGVLVGPFAAFAVLLLGLLLLTPFRQRDEARASSEWWEGRSGHGHSTYLEVRSSLDVALAQASTLRERIVACSTQGEFFDVLQQCEVWDNRAGWHLEHFYPPYGKRWRDAGDHFSYLPSFTAAAALDLLDAKVAPIKAIRAELDDKP